MTKILFPILTLLIFISSNTLFSQKLEIITREIGFGSERTSSISYSDIDNDGDNDIILANGRHWPGQNKILFNNGIGGFTIEKNLGDYRSTSYAAEVGDINGDSFLL